jgi:hypothetical protein
MPRRLQKTTSPKDEDITPTSRDELVIDLREYFLLDDYVPI